MELNGNSLVLTRQVLNHSLSLLDSNYMPLLEAAKIVYFQSIQSLIKIKDRIFCASKTNTIGMIF